MWLIGIEVYAVTFAQYQLFVADLQQHPSLQHHVELLTRMGIETHGLLVGMDRHDKRISPTSDKTGRQRLISICFGTFHRHPFPTTGYEVGTHSRFVAEHQGRQIHPIGL